MVKTLVAGTKSNSLWVNERGIMVEGEKPGTSDNDRTHKGMRLPLRHHCHFADGLPGKFVRSLYEPWARSNRTDVRNLISAFVNVQVADNPSGLCQHLTREAGARSARLLDDKPLEQLFIELAWPARHKLHMGRRARESQRAHGCDCP
jgi:hypothetical protein